MRALTWVVWFALVLSALVQVGVSHRHRVLVQVWDELRQSREALQLEQTRLQLELTALTAYPRIDRRARRELDMIEPDDVRILKP